MATEGFILAGNIWKLLKIEPTKDVTSIKRAYTSIAHGINPEDDSEGFRELHEAYKAAMSYAKSTDAGFANDTADLGVQETSKDTVQDVYDFEQLESSTMHNGSSVEDAIIEDIIFFRKSNKLTSLQDMSAVPHQIKLDLAAEMIMKYKNLADATGDASAWYALFDEPLIGYCEKLQGFQGWMSSFFNKTSQHYTTVNSIIEERKRARGETEPKIIPDDPVVVRKKRNKAIIFFVIGLVLFLITFVLVFVCYWRGMFNGSNDTILYFLLSIPATIGTILIVFSSLELSNNEGANNNGYSRYRSGNDEQSGVHMER